MRSTKAWVRDDALAWRHSGRAGGEMLKALSWIPRIGDVRLPRRDPQDRTHSPWAVFDWLDERTLSLSRTAIGDDRRRRQQFTYPDIPGAEASLQKGPEVAR